jgi:hypothetical protein
VIRFRIAVHQLIAAAYLVTRGNTPVWEKDYDEQFAAKLQMHLDALVTGQKCRTAVYHGAADEWPMGYTPPELIEKLRAEVKASRELWDITSDEESDNDDGEIHKAAGAVGRENEMSATDRPRMPRQAEGLPTPSMSSESPVSTPHKRKRQMGSEDDDKEEERPAKKRARSAREASARTRDTNTVLDTASQQKSRKRRRNVDRDTEEVAKKQSRKVRGVTTAHPSSIWMRRLRPRSKPSTS